MRVMISQSHFFPWIEYIKLINQVDIFVFLDDVQFPNSSRTLQKRVQILNENKIIWLSIPVEKISKNIKANQVKIFNEFDWRSDHLNLLKHTYKKSKNFKKLDFIIENFYKKDYEYLIQATRYSTKLLLNYFDITKNIKILDSIDLNIKAENPNERILKILKEVNATEYITAKGSLNYLDHGNLKKNKIETFYPDYEYFTYKQLNKNFNPFVSTLDFIANSGKRFQDIKPTKLVDWKTYINIKN
tara:strand:+ start:57 stop:788 length:732 start_codon:yes stop_codon:yes gene_type:complete